MIIYLAPVVIGFYKALPLQKKALVCNVYGLTCWMAFLGVQVIRGRISKWFPAQVRMLQVRCSKCLCFKRLAAYPYMLFSSFVSVLSSVNPFSSDFLSLRGRAYMHTSGNYIIIRRIEEGVKEMVKGVDAQALGDSRP